MTSDAQTAANRRNAALSTGPKSPPASTQGRFNALRHGIYAHDVVLPGEDRAAYEHMLDKLRDDLAPEGAIEDGLVGRLCDLWWRLGRTAAVEAGYLNPDWAGDSPLHMNDQLVDIYRKAIDGTPVLDQLGRYEARLERAFARTMNTLHGLQRARRVRAEKPDL